MEEEGIAGRRRGSTELVKMFAGDETKEFSQSTK